MSPLSFDSKSTRGYLLSMAEALRQSVVPEVRGSALTRANECISLLQRIAQELSPSDQTLLALQSLQEAAPERAAEIARREAQVLVAADEDFDRIGAMFLEAAPAPKSFDRDGFERYLQAHRLGGGATRVTAVRQLAGGRSKITTLVKQEGASGLPEELVVRQDWAGGGVQGTTVVSEFDLLQAVSAAGLLVPKPFLIESSDVLGAPFLLVARLPGVQLGSYFHPPRSEGMVLDLAGQLARMHQLPLEPFVAAGVKPGCRTVDEMRAALAGFRSAQHKIGVPSPSILLAIDWLEQQCPKIDTGLSALVHNDIGAHNLLVDDDRLSGILDWELAAIDHPALDLGYARDWIGQVMPWQRFMERYREAGGPSFSSLELDFYTLWAAIRIYVLLINARAAIAAGMIRDMEVVYTAADAIPWLVRRINRLLNVVLQSN